MSRAASQAAGRLPPLPRIRHPLAEVVPHSQLRGINVSHSGRPLPAEERPSSRPRSNLFNRRYSSLSGGLAGNISLLSI